MSQTFKPNITFLRKVEAGECRWVLSRTRTKSQFIGGLKTADAHYEAGLTTTPHSSGAVRLTDAGRAALALSK